MEVITFKQTPLELPVLWNYCALTLLSKTWNFCLYRLTQKPGPGEPTPFSCKLKNTTRVQYCQYNYRLEQNQYFTEHYFCSRTRGLSPLVGQIRKPPFATDQCIILSDCENNAWKDFFFFFLKKLIYILDLENHQNCDWCLSDPIYRKNIFQCKLLNYFATINWKSLYKNISVKKL